MTENFLSLNFLSDPLAKAHVDDCGSFADNLIQVKACKILPIVAYDDLLEACMNILSSQDPAVAAAIEAEYQRQQDGLEMIASENYTSPAVMQAVGSVLTNKYAEGYPGRRYYGGCEHVDTIERLAIERVCQLFGAEAANVQPHSGSQANTAVYMAALQPGDVVLGLDLAQGGHLTHGMHLNISGKLYRFIRTALIHKRIASTLMPWPAWLSNTSPR